MKILHVVNSLKVGGAEILLADIIQELSKRDIKCDICLLYNERELHTKVSNSVDKINILGFHNYNSMLWNFPKIFRLIKIIIRNKYDIIHAHLDASSKIISVLAFIGIIKRINSTQYSINRYSNTLGGRIWYRIDKYLIKKDRLVIIGCSNNITDELRNKYKFIEKNIVTIKNALNFSNYKEFKLYNKDAICEKLNLSPQFKYFVMIGRYDEVKGHNRLLSGLSFLFNNNKNVKFLIIGPRTDSIKLKNIINKFCLEENVIPLGIVEDIKPYLKISEFLISSSYREGLPLTFIESLILGIPVITTDVGGNEEIIYDGKNGFLIDQNEFNKIYYQMDFLLKDEKKLNDMRNFINSMDLSEYSVEKYCNKLINIYLGS